MAKSDKNQPSATVHKSIWAPAIVTSMFLFGITFILPLVIHNGYYDITETKAYCFGSLAAIYILALTVVSAIKAIKAKSIHNIRHIKPDYTEIAIAVFAVVYLVSALLSDRSATVWFGVGARYQGVVAILLYTAVMFAVSHNYGYSQRVLIGTVAAFEIVCIIALLNCYNTDVLGFYADLELTDKSRFISTIGNINFYSSYISLIFPLVIYGFCRAEGALTKAFFGLALAIGSLGVMVSSSESFAVGLVVALSIIPLFFFKDARIMKRFSVGIIIFLVISKAYDVFYTKTEAILMPNVKISLLLNALVNDYIVYPAIAVFVVILLIALKKPGLLKMLHKVYAIVLVLGAVSVIGAFIGANTVLKETDFGIFNEFIKITDSWGSDRGTIWKICIELYRNLPLRQKLFGVGPENLFKFTPAIQGYTGLKLDQAHNEYLQYLITTGLCGLLSYISVLVCVSIKIIKKASKNELAVAIFAGLAAYWVQAFFNIAQPFSTPIMFTFIAWALAESRFSEQKINNNF